MENPKTVRPNFFQSTTAKMILVGLLTLVLLIPLEFVKGLIEERSIRQKEVIKETSQKWGESIYFYGPILKIPYKKYTESIVINEKTKETVTSRTAATHYAFFFPEELKNNSVITMSTPLKRSLYKSNVFTAKMDFSGSYVKPNFEINNIPEQDIMWDKATIVVKTSNMKSIKSQVNIQFDSESYALEPSQNKENSNSQTITTNGGITQTIPVNNGSVESLETKIVNLDKLKNNSIVNFKFQVNYNASEMISIAPIGKTTEAKMVADWHSPSFMGNYLPDEKNKQISKTGFKAQWRVLHLNRPFAQQAFDVLPDLDQYAFGVNFINPVDEYQQNERVSKYGFLVIGLTFLIFFLIQSISKINIPIFQYSMIGLALIMFYTLLISITEHSSFTLAYVIAGSAVIVLITLYSISILKNKRFPLLIGTSLTVLYTFIYIIIQLEDYALLVGSIGLFAILAAVMFFSRKIDWSNN